MNKHTQSCNGCGGVAAIVVLKTMLMKLEKMSAEISALWRHRSDRYSEIRHAADARKKIEMFFIGG